MGQAAWRRGSANVTAVTVHRGGIHSNTLQEYTQETARILGSYVSQESHTRRTPSTRLASAEVQLALRLCTILCNITLPYAPMAGFSAHQHVLGVAGHQCRRPPMRFPPPHEQSS